MNRKAKGTAAERDLIRLFWSTNNWSAHRIAGSGSSHFPSPDIIAGNSLRKLAIECKSTKAIKQYISGEQVDGLKKFSAIFGAEPWIGVKFNNIDWFFLSLDDLKETEGNNFVISIPLAKNKGLSFEQLIQ